MKAYKLEFQKFEMLTDQKPRGRTKQKIKRKVRRKMEREWKKDLKDQDKE